MKIWLMDHLAESKLALLAVNAGKDYLFRGLAVDSIRDKGIARDLVTDIDIKIEKLIFEILEKSSFPIVGEETYVENNDLELSDPRWFVDPIDGTTNFVNRIPHYGVSVGLLQNDNFILGTVGFPVTNEIFHTSGDGKSLLNGEVIKIQKANSIRSCLLGVTFSSSQKDQALRRKSYESFGKVNDTSRGCLRLGSAAETICYVSSGKLQAAFGFEAKIWDVAGSLSIARAIGYEIYTKRISNSSRMNFAVGTKDAIESIVETCGWR